MWFLAVLFGLLLLQAGLEHIAWLIRRRCDQLADMAVAREQHELTVRYVSVLIALNHVTSVLEQLVEAADSHMADDDTRKALAAEVRGAREFIAQRTGPSPFIDRSHAPGSTWPFTKDGEVRL